MPTERPVRACVCCHPPLGGLIAIVRRHQPSLVIDPMPSAPFSPGYLLGYPPCGRGGSTAVPPPWAQQAGALTF
jgi:hypothetical protein